MKTTHSIKRLGKSLSKNSLGINYEMVQERWGIHTSVDKHTVEHIIQLGIIISFPHPSLMKHMRTNNRMQ